MQKFISCDWGSSALRLRVIDTDKMHVLAEAVSAEGISVTFNSWNQSGKQQDERLSFYQSLLTRQISQLEEQLDFSLQDIPLIISGMASSSIGMAELPYKEIPFSTDGHDLQTKIFGPTEDFKHRMLMISGVKTADDAMRGEETQLIGCLNENNNKDQVFIFPGTHSKHIGIKKGRVISVKTYMTGEFFDLLSRKSILSVSVEEGDGLENSKNKISFEKGVKDSAQSNLLHNSFLVRTNGLFDKLTKQENYYYLSGLLIGTELRELAGRAHKKITLVVNKGMGSFYISAFTLLGLEEGDGTLALEDADTALIKGQLTVWNNLEK